MTKRDLYFSLRCSTVAVGKDGTERAVGRVTVVDWELETVLDEYVKVPLNIADYRTEQTGITAANLKNGVSFDQARTQVAKMIKGKILIGHGLETDLSALGLSHPVSDVRDTATYPPLMESKKDASAEGTLMPKELNVLAKEHLKRNVGSPTEEAAVCMDLYKQARKDWESNLMQLVHKKEKQHEVGMRSGGVSVPLSAIREGEIAALQTLPRPQGHWGTSRSTTPTFDDDASSQTGSFFSMDSSVASNAYNHLLSSNSMGDEPIIDCIAEMLSQHTIANEQEPYNDHGSYGERNSQDGSLSACARSWVPSSSHSIASSLTGAPAPAQWTSTASIASSHSGGAPVPWTPSNASVASTHSGSNHNWSNASVGLSVGSNDLSWKSAKQWTPSSAGSRKTLESWTPTMKGLNNSTPKEWTPTSGVQKIPKSWTPTTSSKAITPSPKTMPRWSPTLKWSSTAAQNHIAQWDDSPLVSPITGNARFELSSGLTPPTGNKMEQQPLVGKVIKAEGLAAATPPPPPPGLASATSPPPGLVGPPLGLATPGSGKHHQTSLTTEAERDIMLSHLPSDFLQDLDI